jgi:hypothetical protein
MRLERFHRSFKQKYMEEKKAKRVDRLVDALLDLEEDLKLKRVNYLGKGGKHNKKSAVISDFHKRGVSLIVQCQRVYSESCNISFETDRERVSIIKHHPEHISSTTCMMKCNNCSACIHSFVCNCIVYAIDGNLCKHTHAACVTTGLHSSAIVSNDDITTEMKLLERDIVRQCKKAKSGHMTVAEGLISELTGLL